MRLFLYPFPMSCLCLLIGAFLVPLTASAAGVESRAWLELGLRQDDLDWNIAGDLAGANPNIISELQWKSLVTLQLQGSFEMLWHNFLFMRGYLGYGTTSSGDNQDSDFAYDNRQGEFSRSNNKGDGGYMADTSIGLGVQFEFRFATAGNLQLIPLLGYASDRQQVKMRDGVQTVSDTTTARNAGLIGPTQSIIPVGYQLSDLDSQYRSTWYGPWLGVDVNYRPRRSSRLLLRFELHKADLYGEGDWNLRSDFQHPRSYEHITDGYGRVFTLGWQTLLASKWDVKLSYTLQSWISEPGLIRFFRTDGTRPEQQLNQVNWQSRALFVSVGYDFSRD